MPVIDNFQCLVAVGDCFLQEYETRTRPANSGTSVETFVESPLNESYRLLVGTCEPALEQTDLVVYILIDGSFVASRLLLRGDTASTAEISGMSLSNSGYGPLALENAPQDPTLLPLEIPPVPGTIRLLVYRGKAKPTSTPSLFSYPSYVSPFVFSRVSGVRGVEVDHITGYATPVKVAQPYLMFDFRSQDPAELPYLSIDFFYRSPQQILQELSLVTAPSWIEQSQPHKKAAAVAVDTREEAKESAAGLDARSSGSRHPSSVVDITRALSHVRTPSPEAISGETTRTDDDKADGDGDPKLVQQKQAIASTSASAAKAKGETSPNVEGIGMGRRTRRKTALTAS